MKSEQRYHNGAFYFCEVIKIEGRYKALLIKTPPVIEQKIPIRFSSLEKEEFYGDTSGEAMLKCKQRMNEILGEQELREYKSIKK